MVCWKQGDVVKMKVLNNENYSFAVTTITKSALRFDLVYAVIKEYGNSYLFKLYMPCDNEFSMLIKTATVVQCRIVDAGDVLYDITHCIENDEIVLLFESIQDGLNWFNSNIGDKK